MLPTKTALKIVKLVVSNPDMYYREIAAKLGCTVSQMKTVLTKAEIKRNRGVHKGQGKKVDEPKILAWLKANPKASCREAAKVFNHHPVTIQILARKNGLARTARALPSPKTIRGLEMLKNDPKITFREVAKRVGVSEITIGHHAHLAGFARRRGPYGDPIVDHELVISVLKNKPWLTAVEAAKECGCAANTLRNLAKKHGIPRSDRVAKLLAAIMGRISAS